MDQKIFLFLFEYSKKNKYLNKLSLFITKSSSKIFFCIYISLLLNLYMINKNDILITITIPAIALCCNTILRKTVKRIRPYETMNIELDLKKSDSYSFPSNHSSSAMIIALMCLLQNTLAGIIIILLAILTGTSRILTGMHYPSDVIAGFLLSITIFLWFLYW